MKMTDRQRFLAMMHYKARDRAPLCDFGFWPETIEGWHQQGLPQSVYCYPEGGSNTNAFFGMDEYTGGPVVHCGLLPGFDHKIIEDRGAYELVQQGDGVTVLREKFRSTPPQPHQYLLIDRASWRKHYKPRLNPDNPDRYPIWKEVRKAWADRKYPTPRTVSGGSLFGWLRDWMGIEGISYVIHDHPRLFEEMVATIADLVVEAHRRAFAHGAQFDACCIYEDMCYERGPLLAPEHFEKYLLPHYKRIAGQLRRRGCDVIAVDSDGNIEALIPLWLEAGVNCMMPVEIGRWGADPVKYRKQYGKELSMMGGFDKQILAGTARGIAKEIQRLTPLVEEGGYIPFCDHGVPPIVSLKNYMFYLETARKIWGKGVNLKPLNKLEKRTV